jgi:hypothetical protein
MAAPRWVEPAALEGGEVAVLKQQLVRQRGGRAATVGLVEHPQLLEENPPRPRVGDEVVVHAEQLVLLVLEPHQPQP